MGRIKEIISSTNVRNVTKLLSANVVAQAIGLIVYPILTRMYTPEDFGVLNLYVSICSVLVIIATAEYPYAIVLPKKFTEARAVFQLSICILLASTVLLSLSIPWADEIAALFKSPKLAKYYHWIPLSVMALGLWNVLNYWYIRQSNYNRIGGYQLSQSILSSSVKLCFGAVHPSAGGLIASMVIAPVLSVVLSLSIGFRSVCRRFFVWSKSSLLHVARMYSNFPRYTMPRSLLNIFAGQLPVLLLTPLFGSEAVGYWGMALLLGFAPISMLTKTVYQVLYQHTTSCVHAMRPIGGMFRRFTIGCILIVVPLFGVLYVFLPALTAWLLGDVWELSGEYIRWMLPWLFCSILTSSTGFLADIFFKQKIGFWFEVLTAVLRMAGVGIGVYYHDFSLAIMGYCIGSCLSVLSQYVWLLSLVRNYDFQIADR